MSLDLLQVVELPWKQQGREPLLLEHLEVNPQLAPYLVSGSRQTQWVMRASKSGTVRAAIRSCEDSEADILSAIADLSERADWGSSHPLTTQGIQSCIDHIRSYIDEPLEGLVSPNTDLEGVAVPESLPLQKASWMPADLVAVLPQDRSYLGTMWAIAQGRVAFLVHNSSRGVALAWRR